MDKPTRVTARQQGRTSAGRLGQHGTRRDAGTGPRGPRRLVQCSTRIAARVAAGAPR